MTLMLTLAVDRAVESARLAEHHPMPRSLSRKGKGQDGRNPAPVGVGLFFVPGVGIRWPRNILQGICGSAIALSDRRDRSFLSVLSLVRPGLIRQGVANPPSWGTTLDLWPAHPNASRVMNGLVLRHAQPAPLRRWRGVCPPRRSRVRTGTPSAWLNRRHDGSWP